MLWLYITTAAALGLPLFSSRFKTFKAIKIASKRFLKILPIFLFMLVLQAVAITLVPNELASQTLCKESEFTCLVTASLSGQSR